ncbi:MAG: sulfur carrier protein ThiS [Candidatus Hydrogenedentes bacterium]|nr:sulfur carrier protein ThiS [Candidatus Hydrogenedentota bacterium]
MTSLLDINVNGEKRSVASSVTILHLITAAGLNPESTAVQRNEEIVPRSAYAETILQEGDVIELVRFVGGG